MPMMRNALLLAPLLLIAACSVSVAPKDAATPTPTPAAAPVATATPTPKPIPAAADTPVRPGMLKTFGDWAVGCDNTALCTMASLGPDGGLFPCVTLAILRQPGPQGGFDLAFDVPGEGRPVTPVALAIDGRRYPLPTLGGPAVAPLVKAMANATTLTVLEANDRRRATLSLKGASAALRWIDAQQGRAGTTTAAVATGSNPASTVPQRPTAPVVRAVATRDAAQRPTAAQLSRMRKMAACEDERIAAGGEIWQPELHALGDGATLVMLPCSAGAYNLSSALFVLRGDAVAPAPIDAPSGFGPTPAADLDTVASVVNGTWDQGALTSYAKGRGLGDCGVSQTFVWDGNRLRLTEQSEMGECRGNPNYITTWRTQVVRR